MNFSRTLIFISLFLVTLNCSPAESSSENEDAENSHASETLKQEERKKTLGKCPSLTCHELLETHNFGVANRLCPGRSVQTEVTTPTITVVKKSKKATGKQKLDIGRLPSSSSSSHNKSLRQQLVDLEEEERTILESLTSNEEQTLLSQIVECQAALQLLRSNNQNNSFVPTTSASHHMDFQI